MVTVPPSPEAVSVGPPVFAVGAAAVQVPSPSAPATGGGGFVGVTADRPEVRALVEFMASPEWGAVWARGGAQNNFLSPNQRFDTANYRRASDDPAGAVRETLGTELLAALAAGEFRFDGSDLMPASIGAVVSEFELGAFWQGMVNLVDGTRTMDQVLADVEAAWVALEAADSG